MFQTDDIPGHWEGEKEGERGREEEEEEEEEEGVTVADWLV